MHASSKLWTRLILWGGVVILTGGLYAGARALQEPPWTKADARTLVEYAVALGRASGCGLSVEPQKKLMEGWVTRHFQPFPEQFQSLMALSLEKSKAMQASHPVEDCASVKTAFTDIRWEQFKPTFWQELRHGR